MKIRSFFAKLKWRLTEDIMYLKSPNAFVFGVPCHSNAGDQAQSYCIELWIKQHYPKHKIRMYDSLNMLYTQYELLDRLKIFLHSGYHTTDLYMLEEDLQRRVIQAFPRHRIIILPQTVNYTTEEEKNNSIRIYNAHKDVFLFCRDAVSYQSAQELFPACRLFLYPDIVTSLIGRRQYHQPRKGILLCLRNDIEAVLTEQDRQDMIRQLSAIDEVSVTDTTLDIAPEAFSGNRAAILEDLWKTYAGYRAVITDRYHGTIFSLIAATPVLVLPSSDHKLKSGVDWFPESYRDYVKYVPDTARLTDEVQNIYQTDYDYCLPPYFEEQYYNQLKSIIDGD